jgi:hypothetical protein
MINKIKGILYYTDHTTIEKVFGKAFTGITVKPRIFGFDIKYDDARTELFITTTDNSEKEYFVDISFAGDKSDFDLIKDILKKEIIEHDILFDLSFIHEDDNGNELEEEERFVHPDFSTRYIPPSI